MRFEILHKLEDEQYAGIVSAIRGVNSTLLVNVLRQLTKEVEKMGLRLEGLEAAVESVRSRTTAIAEDVPQIKALVEELRAKLTDPADQATIDAITEKLNSIATQASVADAEFDSLTAPAPEPASVTEMPTDTLADSNA